MSRSCQHVGVHVGLERPGIHQLDLGPTNVWYCEYHDAVGPAPPEMGAEQARTSRSSSIPSRRPCLARASTLACMLVLSAPGSTSLILAQQTYGTASTMTLSVLRLLRWARNKRGRRGLRRLALGPGSVVSFLVDVRPSAGVYPTTHLLWWRWDRCGRNSCLRSLLLRWHVDEENEYLARVDAGSGSHNLDTPLPGAPKMSGKLIHEQLWGRRTWPLSVRRGRIISWGLDAPCRGKPIHEHLWGQRTGPLSVRRGAEIA